ncbi:jg21418, partial [Pararge aegeria aegeria]
SCGTDDFHCNDGKCIENYRRCNRQIDCPGGEDEAFCECRSDEFRCQDDGSCIENRKRCNGNNECRDGSDELNCAQINGSVIMAIALSAVNVVTVVWIVLLTDPTRGIALVRELMK